MKKIFIRSPYFIQIEATETAKFEIFLWNKGTSEPTNPNYTITEKVPSPIQNVISVNVANYAKEFIKPVAPVVVSVPTEENVNTWCYMKVKTYADNVLDNTETFVCLNGYTNYLGGYNQNNTNAVVTLVNTDIKLTHNKYINCWIDEDLTHTYSWVFGFTEYDIDSYGGVWKLPLYYSNENYLYYGDTTFFNIISDEVCEPKYTPITCTFINRYGGWQFLTFFKASSESIETDYKEFNLMPADVNYNVLQGQRKRFNHQGKQTIKCNTGWVDENYFELIQDLLLSEVVLLDNKPVVVKSKSSEKKTHIKDKTINYEIEFEYNFGLINDVI